MNVSLYQAAAALDANANWQEMVADNLASSSMPGFKRKELSLEAVRAGLLPGNGSDAQSFVMPKATMTTNFEVGPMQSTGVNTDVAIDGQGFFKVQMPNGIDAFTRDGEFHVDAAGKLVSKEGYGVMGALGPIQLNASSHAPVSISGSGNVSQGSAIRGKIQLTDFKDPQLLTQATGSYFVATDSKVKVQPTTATLRQGYIEGSNVSTVTQMVNLLTASRSFEANQKIIQMEDERMSHAITDLGNPT